MVVDKEYSMIFKRKSFRKFNDSLKLTNEELHHINEKIKELTSLVENIEVKYRIVRRDETTCNLSSRNL